LTVTILDFAYHYSAGI